LFESGKKMSFSLKDNQRLTFVDTPVGSHYTIEELESKYYIPGVTVVYDKNLSKNITLGTPNTKLTLPNSAIDSTMLFVSEDGSSANFLNTRDDVVPTGLNLNNLQFFAMIVLALGALGAYITVKHRKRKHEATSRS